ncbi:MAG: bifunctional diaminohydroxyphosphoribosylaminopyrimidine deaminase/5-amino-6-(5-phosphoribosylamino)uracil reductase RibD [Candidatus Eisenbacteria bacterium]
MPGRRLRSGAWLGVLASAPWNFRGAFFIPGGEQDAAVPASNHRGSVKSRSRDDEFMAEALALAERGAGRTRPNPRVGSVVVRAGKVIGRGWHRRLGAAHAECVALADAGARAKGATLYVTLEPCVHDGRTPPCVPKILAAGIGRVVVAHRDPDPRVSGRGLAWLRRAGVEVTVGVLADAARSLNAGYLSAHERGRPRIALKLAASLDGRVAPARGSARWTTRSWSAPRRCAGTTPS